MSRLEAWAASGGMWLTGHAEGPPLAVDADVLAAAQEQLPQDVDAATFLFGRAALLGLSRNGRRAAGGSCRLLRTADGWCAVNLARPEDVASIPAILERDVDDPEAALEDAATSLSSADLAGRAQLLGVPAAALGSATSVDAVRVVHLGDRGPARPRPRVVDLSSLWAGPLCAHLLGLGGAEVVKVESAARPDGARKGPPAFFDWLHAGHASEVVDFATDDGRAELRRLIDGADVVIEASRPRALRQLGIEADEVVAGGAGRVWLSITGYGRDSDQVAFGDDAAVAGGLVARDDAGTPVFCGDAIADPLSGIAAAAAVRTAVADGGGVRIDVAMAGVAAAVAARRVAVGEHHVRPVDGGWEVEHDGEVFPVLPPRPPA